MPSARWTGATAPNVDLNLEDVNYPDFQVRYLNGKVCINHLKTGVTKAWRLIPKPDNVGNCKLETMMHCGDGLDEPHDTYLNIQQAMRRNTAALTGGKPILFSELREADRQTIFTLVQSEYNYLFCFLNNWAENKILRRICCNKRDTVANKQDCKKGTRCGGRRGKRHCNPADNEGTSNNGGDVSQGKNNPPAKDIEPVKDSGPVEHNVS
ncbi:hypothetical protein BN14_09169 [Rhizoctonia solani AG-1 IB]|uniref:Uncharacterized protein n=1 Tax=Thanatephorus cucumeris (strain AG1-IB / isolate 7/3/14) TaxID=1108050 RepID=M5C7M1_THACB|nr:hypothetical protein BN14_09169 [Rhizoctonia solani AG-1 IB]